MATPAWICLGWLVQLLARGCPRCAARQLASFVPESGRRLPLADSLRSTSPCYVLRGARSRLHSTQVPPVAELLRLVRWRFAWVLFPSYAKDGKSLALPKAAPCFPAPPSSRGGGDSPGVGRYVFIPVLYGPACRPAIIPTEILICGLATIGVTGVIGRSSAHRPSRAESRAVGAGRC